MTDFSLFEIKTNNLTPVRGSLLVAEPLIHRDIFHRSVILIVDHENDGSFGVILNKLANVNLSELMPELELDLPVFIGGPLNADHLYFIHSIGPYIENSIEIEDGVYWGGNFENVKELISMKELPLDKIHFFLGYSGWSESQLEQEMKANNWSVAKPSDLKHVLTIKPEELWAESVKMLGNAYLHWLIAPDIPEFN